MSLLAVEDLNVSFGGVHAVKNLCFNVEDGEIFSIVGPNGAGKTTLFNLICGIYQPTSGQIYLGGQSFTGEAAHRIAGRGIARTFQNIELFDKGTVLQNLMLGRHCHFSTSLVAEFLRFPKVKKQEVASRRKVENVIDFLDLQRHRWSTVGELPYGIRKIVELGRALAMEPKIILLDEPSSGLNSEETEEMAFWINDIRDHLGITVLMIEHDMSLVGEVSDRVMAINNGEVITIGSVAEVQSHPEVVRAYLGE